MLLGYIFNIDKDITKYFYTTTDSIKKTYMQTLTFLKDGVNFYIFQLETIDQLRSQINKNKNYKILYESTNNELKILNNELNGSQIEFDTIYTKVVSYTNLNDYSKVILDKDIPENKIYPLLMPQGYSAGIAMLQDKRSMALLNNNPKCNYAVFIGNSNAPGITSGTNERGEIIIRHIPIWFKINIDDEVITSGMDRVFPTGIKVGKIVAVKELVNTKEAYVKPYIDVLTKKHFYMIEKK